MITFPLWLLSHPKLLSLLAQLWPVTLLSFSLHLQLFWAGKGSGQEEGI